MNTLTVNWVRKVPFRSTGKLVFTEFLKKKFKYSQQYAPKKVPILINVIRKLNINPIKKENMSVVTMYFGQVDSLVLIKDRSNLS